jgi:hypothetical protein
VQLNEPSHHELIDKRRPPGSLVRAVAVGLLVVLGGTLIVAFLAGVIYVATMTSRGQTNDQIRRALEALVPWSGFGLLLSVLGFTVSVLAGYLCAAVANRRNYLAPGVLSAISVACAAYAAGSGYSIWPVLGLSAITVAVTLTGAWLCIQRAT